MILTAQDIEDLTKKKRPSAQARELAHLGIKYRVRTDGTLIVFLDDVRPIYATATEKKKREPQLRIA